jgi:cytoskeletal protein RodZ
MSENIEKGSLASSSPENGAAPIAPETSAERVGEILKKAREERRISIEAIAKRLRLNAKYIEALEANHYEQIPGDTYIRVYLRSLSSFLALNSEEIFRRFFEERGLTGADTLRKDSKTKINLSAVPDKEKPNATLVVTISVVAVLALVSFLANSQGWFSSHADRHAQNGVDSLRGQTAAVEVTNGNGRVSTGTTVKYDSIAPVEKPAILEEKTGNTKAAVFVPTPEKQRKDSLHQTKKTPVTEGQKKDSLQKIVPPPALKKEVIKSEAKSTAATLVKSEQAVIAQPIKDTVKQVQPPVVTGKKRDTAQKVGAIEVKTAASVQNKKDTVQRTQTPITQTKDTAVKIAFVAVKQSKDTVQKGKPTIEKSVVKDTVRPATKNASAVVQSINKPLKLRMTVVGDSCWARVFSDGGNQWRNIVGNGRGVTFTAQDSFNVHVGSVASVAFTLNGKPVTLPEKKGVLSFKIEKSGVVTLWTRDQWNAAFKDAFILPAPHVDR